MRHLIPRFSYFAVLTVVLVEAGLQDAAAEDSVSGIWKVLVTQEGSQRDYYLELKQDGSAVAGTFNSPRSGDYPFDGGKFEGRKLRIDVNRKMGDRTAVYSIDAEMTAPGKLEGKLLIDGNEAGQVEVTRRGCVVQGRWDVSSKVGEGREYHSLLVLMEAEGTLQGKSFSRLGTIELKSVSFEGDKLRFELVLPMQGTEVLLEVEATLKDANTLVGRWKRKEAEASGEWMGTRTLTVDRPAVDPALAGKWFGVVVRPNGTSESFEIEFVPQEGGLVVKVRLGRDDLEVQELRAAGTRIECVIPYRDNGDQIKVKVEGQLKDGILGGKWSVETGESGEWSARKPLTL